MAEQASVQPDSASAPPPSADRWYCGTCGSPGAYPVGGRLGAFTSFDPRYTTGYCDTCSDPNPTKPRKNPRPTTQIILESAFDPTRFRVAKDKEKLGNLVRAIASKEHVQLTDLECWTLCDLWDRYGYPGYEPNESIRKGAAKYTQGLSAAGKDKKRKR